MLEPIAQKDDFVERNPVSNPSNFLYQQLKNPKAEKMNFESKTQNSWRAVLGKVLLFLTAFLLLLLSSQFSQAQIIAWNFDGNIEAEITVDSTSNDTN